MYLDELIDLLKMYQLSMVFLESRWIVEITKPRKIKAVNGDLMGALLQVAGTIVNL